MNYEYMWNKLKKLIKITLREESVNYGYTNTKKEYAEKYFNEMKNIEVNASLDAAGY